MIGVIKNYKIYIANNKIIKDFNNFYYFSNTGNAAHPCIILKKIVNKKVTDIELIGGIKELIEYMIENDEKMFLINGFGRANIGRIYKLYLENAMEKKQEIIKNNEEKIKILKKDDKEK